ncbi:hypothetical protein NA66_100978 [Burkholderia pyrrocinia]|uniref:Uncharacterized protein n=1 Tax=Burkholderia pyrrocinia TaxID=60550 RepID=A0A318IKQ9_BURPY|nr:hypothetical protein NA66_100978 [Burkholderia pyrrocinia]SFW64274.1 hypothetical protein SAMN03159384_03462 [Burkholderia sp. NFACC33-1]SFY22944.1 hypothetical protein SAMN03159408_03706 [Burkholderia sp. NFPP32]
MLLGVRSRHIPHGIGLRWLPIARGCVIGFRYRFPLSVSVPISVLAVELVQLDFVASMNELRVVV